ncbi:MULTISPECIES: YqzK family protein [Paenibacillus]|uniref:YqzK family protein n=1 Tax=Paenibacillus TaxID=44249 RepID=UPI0022B8F64C|nr:YqzK family protein [Paenibacillus caseinilyticus]MCZ8520610.1 YqzK family protein [Paenibacillus caseinilyticus]
MILHFSLRRWKERFRFLVLFTAFTVALYHALLLITGWIEPGSRYREPSGRAVKVFLNEGDALAGTGTIRERLKLFYEIGE